MCSSLGPIVRAVHLNSEGPLLTAPAPARLCPCLCPCPLWAVGFSLGAMSGLYSSTMKALGASERVFDLMERQPAMRASGTKAPALYVQATGSTP